MIAVIWVNLRRAMGDRRLLIIGTLVPVVIILITGLLEGSPKEPIGLYHPSARLLHLAQTTDGIKVRVESTKQDLTDDILRGRVVAGIVQLPAPGNSVRADFLVESSTTDAVQARTDAVALMDLMAAEGSNTKFTDATLQRHAGGGAAEPVLVRGAGQPGAVHGHRRAGPVGRHGRDATAGGAAAALGRPGAQAGHRVRSDGQHDGHRGQHGDRVDLRRVRAVPGALGQPARACSW